MVEIVKRSDVGIDLHTGSDHRTNLPHIRADLDDPETRKLAEAFGAPLMLHARVRDGSLRAAATESGATMLLYEGGEAWRFDERALEVGVRGVRNVLAELAMIEPDTTDARQTPGRESQEHMGARSSEWVGAACRPSSARTVARGDLLGVIHDSVGNRLSRITAPRAGVVIGHIQHPLVNQGDAVVHIADVPAPDVPTADTTAPS